ncbi:alkaline phosphatase family protein [Bdellovibrionota bacterium FG-2]
MPNKQGSLSGSRGIFLLIGCAIFLSSFSAHAFSGSRNKSKIKELRARNESVARNPATVPAAGWLDPSIANVILVTVDGVRWQEVFRGLDPDLGATLSAEESAASSVAPFFEWLKGKALTEGFLWGNVDRGDDVRVANPSWKSLPAYQSIFAGATQACISNSCGRVAASTLQERLVDAAGADFSHDEVVTIASWSKIALAVESVEGKAFVNAGIKDLFDGGDDEELAAINRDQAKEVPSWSDARFDRYTFKHALRYLKRHEPRFLFISFDDADEWGHLKKYPEYIKSLRFYDQAMKTLVETVDSMKDYGESTTIILTTDHGRGSKTASDNEWPSHGSGFAGSDRVWIYGRNALTRSKPALSKAGPGRPVTHLDIRPTVEALFGLKPQGPGKVVSELIANKP